MSLRTSLPAILWFLLIMVLLSLPGTSFPEVRFWKPDKFAHIGLFGMQTVLLWIALASAPKNAQHTARSLVIAALLTLIFGALSEYYQDVFTSRMADVYDVIANGIGIILACIAVLAIGRTRLLALAHRLLRPRG